MDKEPDVKMDLHESGASAEEHKANGPDVPGEQKQAGETTKERKRRFESNKKYFTVCIYAIGVFCVCLFIFKFTNNWQVTKARIKDILDMLSPFLIAFLIAYFINPMIRKTDRILTRLLKGHLTGLHRMLSLLLAYVVVIGFIVLVLTFIIPQIGSSVMELVKQAPHMYQDIVAAVDGFILEHPNMNLEAIQQFVNENLPNIFAYFQNLMTNIVPMIYSVGLSFISWVINIVLAFVISCYLMWDKANLLYGIKKILFAFVAEDDAGKVLQTVKKCNEIFSAYIIGKAIDSLIIGIICFIVMCILKLPYAVLISVIVGITNMIPYFGPFIGAVPGALILLIINPQQALIFVIMVFVLQQFDGNILGPKILGDSTGLQPLWIIFAITVGGYMAGVVGMFLGVPVVAVIAYLMNMFVDHLLNKRHLSQETEEILTPPTDSKGRSEKVSLFQRIKLKNNKKS